MIYLVSACGSGEEFVAAFRRYADRNGLFIPMAEPIAAGRRGRFAVALKDGGVMIEGEAEVVSSARTPSVLHGRVGMTLRFVDPDEQSKTVLVELEKARLSMRPPPPSVPPRPADIPPEPRAVPPAPAGRIDANNALAECVAIGDVEALGVVASAPPPKAGPKFVVPTIPPVGGARTKAPTVPPEARPGEPPRRSEPMPAVEPAPKRSAPMPAVEPAPKRSAPMPAIEPPRRSAPISAAEPPRPEPLPLPLPLPIVEDVTTDVASIDSLVPDDAPAGGRGQPAKTEPMPFADTPASPASLALPAVAAPTAPKTDPVIPAQTAPKTDPVIPAQRGPKTDPVIPAQIDPSGPTAVNVPPPAPAPAPPPAPSPAPEPAPAAAPAMAAAEVSETTDLTTIPTVPEDAEESPLHAISALAPPPKPAAPPAAARRPPIIEEGTPSGDWTMKPGADGPTIERRVPPKSTPAGDWLISLDPKSDDGWSEPARVPAPAPVAPPPPAPPPPPPSDKAAGPKRRKSEPLIVTSTRPLESEPRHPGADLPAVSEPKVQVDPTLIEPLVPMPALDGPALDGAAPPPPPPLGGPPAMEPPMAASSSSGMRLQHLLTPIPGMMPAPYGAAPSGTPPLGPGPAYPMEPGQAAPPISPLLVPLPRMPAPTELGGNPNDATYVVRRVPGSEARSPTETVGRKRRMIVIAASAGLVAVVGIVLAVVLSGGDDSSESRTAVEPKPAPAVAPDSASAPPDAAALAATTLDAAEALAPAPPDAAVATTDTAPGDGKCTFDVTSAPPGAEVLDKAEVIATTPAKLTFPCDVEVKLTFRKRAFVTVERKFTPTAKNKPLKVALAKPTFAIKVSSTPNGATVFVGGRSLGVTTPTTIRLPAGETSTVTFQKEGYAPETQKITARQNNQAVNVTLRKTVRKVFR